MSVLDSYYFCLSKSRCINISEFIRIKDPEEINEVKKMFLNESLSKVNKGIIIPMKYSHKISFNSSMLEEVDEEKYQKTFKVMSHIKDIQYYWEFNLSDQLENNYLPLLPARTEHTLFITYFDLKTDPDLDEKLRMLNWNDKRICSIDCMTLSDENYSFVVFLLEIQKVQEWLDSIKLKTQNLTNCLKVMELLLNCKLIDSIELEYLTSDIDNEEEAIRESVQKLIKQVGLINTIEITKVKQDSGENLNEEYRF